MERLLVLAPLLLWACGGEPGMPELDGGVSSLDGSASDGGRSRRDGSTAQDASTSVDGGGGERALVHFIGRFEVAGDDDARFAWPGSAIAARFDGTDLTVDSEDGGESWFEVYVDGLASDFFRTMAGRHSYAVATGLPSGEHAVVVARRTESFFGETRFRGFTGSPLVESEGPTRFIELVGDSITCGYGVLGDGPSCGFTAHTEAETHAWGALAARDLDAGHASIAYSGKGVYRNNGGDTNEPMPEIFGRTFADAPGSAWGFSGYTPDAVVVNLGTNDFSGGDPGGAFVDAMETFVADLRGHYPDAWILLATSPMLGGADHVAHRGYLDTVVERAGDARVVVVEIAEQDSSDGYGCDYHPNETTQRKMADALVAELRARLGW